MDGKPQRGRILAAQGNENIPLPHVQSIHQRHKSTGNLQAAVAQNGGMKVAAKRSAFGDVSNVARGAVGIEAGKTGKAAVTSLTDTKENGGISKGQLSRPAQRQPLAAGHQPRTGNFPAVAASAAAKTQAVVKQTAVKRATLVYHDAQSTFAGHAGQVGNVQGPSLEPSAPSHLPRHHRSQPQLKAEKATLPPVDFIGEEPPSCASTIIDEAAEVKYEDAVENLLDGPYQSVEPPSGVIPTNEEIKELTQITSDLMTTGPRHRDTTQALSEIEEHWYDYEDDDLVEDHEAYTTAHSLRLPGDTAALALPRLSSKVQRELDEARDYVELHRTQEEEEEDMYDVSMAAEYGEDIFQYMRELEMKLRPNPHYMDKQNEIQWSMRAVLMDWLVQVHFRFGLLPETLFLTVNYIDRFLSSKIVSIGKLQLVGATAILIASKYEEINCPSLQEIEFMVDGGYTVEEIIKAERFMLSMLSFELGWPGPMSFLRRVSKADDYDLETRTLAKYFLEVTIMDERFVGSPPSFLAAGAHCLSRMMLGKGEWSKAHVHYSGYTLAQLAPLLSLLLECCQSPRQHHSAVFDKYSDKRYKKCAEYVALSIDGGFTVSIGYPAPSTLPQPPPANVEHHDPMDRFQYPKLTPIEG